ncbi:MAG: transposase zinc-binding domain-containing protein [Bdellovibrio sp.]|nr:transposase zinc-binding domain-containing protein [Bdellovibrio sp.]
MPVRTLIAFSCKRRGFCISCGARRMSETAAHLVESVLAMQPIRHWVFNFPFQIRMCLAVRPKIMAKALDIRHGQATLTLDGVPSTLSLDRRQL